MRQWKMAGAAAAAALAFAPAALAQAWEPQRLIEIVVPSGPSGGNDTAARMVQSILQMRDLVKVTPNVVNKPGGGGAVAFTYLNQHAGDGRYVSVIPITLLTNHITGRSSFTYTDFTPIAQLYSEYISFVVRPDSPIKDGKDLIARLRQDPGSVTFAFASSAGNQNHIAIGILAKAANVPLKQIRTVVFNAGGQAITAMLGGHVDVSASGASGSLANVQAGKARVVGVAAPQRLPGALAAVPTWKELGFNAVFSSWRSMIGPNDMTPAQLAYWDGVIRNMMATEEWKKALEANLWVDQYMDAKESRAYLAQQYAEIRTILTDLGLAAPVKP